MFVTVSLLALVAPLVSALTLNAPTDWTSGGPATITWSDAAGDPSTWSFELVNTVFHNSFAVANNVNPTPGTLSFTLPVVPAGDGYTLEAVALGNISQIYATSSSFSIGPSVSGSTTSGASSTGSGSSSGTATGSVTSSSVVATGTGIGGTSFSFGTTNTAPASTAPASGSSTSAQPAASTVSSSNGAASLKVPFSTSHALALLGVVAGAAVVAL